MSGVADRPDQWCWESSIHTASQFIEDRYSAHAHNCFVIQVLTENGALIEIFPIDTKPFYIFGRVAETSDIILVSLMQNIWPLFWYLLSVFWFLTVFKVMITSHIGCLLLPERQLLLAHPRRTCAPRGRAVVHH